VVHQPFAIPLVGNLAGVREQRLEIAICGDQIARALLTNAGHPLDVVD
jgi:hypothetical protein